MDPKHLDELFAVEADYWWHVAKRELVTELLQRYYPPPRCLVEGGPGAGLTLLHCQQLGYNVQGLDWVAEARDYCQQRGLQAVQLHDLEEPWPLAPGSVDVVLFLDVLEHLRQPQAALRHALTTLAPGGGVLASVPAYPFLFGPWDEMLGHYRRYTRKTLLREMAAVGLKPRWLSYWNSFSLPPALVIRSLEKWRRSVPSAKVPVVSRFMNKVLLWCARRERSWLHRAGLPCGLSLIGVFSR